MKKIILIFLFFLIGLSVNAVNTYYVATAANGGSDSNPGSNASPWLTFQKAANSAVAGDIVIFKDGTYYYTISTMVTLSTSGNAGAYITYKAQNKGGAILDGSSNTATYGIVLSSASYINIEGFTLQYFSHDAIVTVGGNSNSYVNIRDVHIQFCGRICTDAGANDYSIGIGGTYFHNMNHVVVERCMFNDIGRLSPAEGCSTATGTLDFDHGLYIGNCDDWVIKNNIFYNCYRGFGIQLYDSGSGTDSNISIINNTFVDGNPFHPAGHIILWTNLSNILIANNIMDGQIYYGMQLYQAEYTTSNVVITNNIEYGGNNQLIFYTTLNGVTLSNNHEATNPLFVGRSSHNYHLTSSSPARDAGYATGITTDYDQYARSGTIDIGAFEYVSGVTTYYSAAASGSATRNNCTAGQTGSSVLYTVPYGTYTSTTSQVAADNLAIADVTANKQAYANANGTCTTVVIHGNLTVGSRLLMDSHGRIQTR